jgi:hypothetical protein
MSQDVLNEAYQRFHRKGPEWGENRLTNHGPMVVEVLTRRGRAAEVDRWVDGYLRRLEELPTVRDRITDLTWRQALGDVRRIGDWTAYFTHEVTQRPWPGLLAEWWPRLLPGLLAGTTHGVIRVGHAVRALRAGGFDGDDQPDRKQSGAQPPSQATLTELAHGLAFWAARVQYIPGATEPAGRLDPATALDAMPRIADRHGSVAHRLGQLPAVPSWTGAVAALRPPTDPDDAGRLLRALVDAATRRYINYGHGSPVLLVHTATAPNALLHILPVLPREHWAPSLFAAWAATAAITTAYAPRTPDGRRSHPERPPDRTTRSTAPSHTETSTSSSSPTPHLTPTSTPLTQACWPPPPTQPSSSRGNPPKVMAAAPKPADQERAKPSDRKPCGAGGPLIGYDRC